MMRPPQMQHAMPVEKCTKRPPCERGQSFVKRMTGGFRFCETSCLNGIPPPPPSAAVPLLWQGRQKKTPLPGRPCAGRDSHKAYWSSWDKSTIISQFSQWEPLSNFTGRWKRGSLSMTEEERIFTGQLFEPRSPGAGGEEAEGPSAQPGVQRPLRGGPAGQGAHPGRAAGKNRGGLHPAGADPLPLRLSHRDREPLLHQL